jgi:hypothetical protein
MLAGYAGMRASGVPLGWIVAIFALGTAAVMVVIMLWHRKQHEVYTDYCTLNKHKNLYTPLSK